MPKNTEARETRNGHSHYDVLQLPRHGDWNRLSEQDVKRAYRRALLVHHPDKAPNSRLKQVNGDLNPLYSIDDIAIAYEVLSDPAKRAAYNEMLDRNEISESQGAVVEKGTHIGVEIYDLEDLVYVEAKHAWSKGCRCGDEHGYILTESDLEAESPRGEIYVGCQGCSLFIKVLFASEDP